MYIQTPLRKHSNRSWSFRDAHPGWRQAASSPGTETPGWTETGSPPAAGCCWAPDASGVSGPTGRPGSHQKLLPRSVVNRTSTTSVLLQHFWHFICSLCFFILKMSNIFRVKILVFVQKSYYSQYLTKLDWSCSLLLCSTCKYSSNSSLFDWRNS